MIRFAATLVAVAMAMAMAFTVEAMPGIQVSDRAELWIGSAFIAVLNAGLRPALRVGNWPITAFTYAAAVVALNGIALTVGRGLSVAWDITSFWQGLLLVGVVSGVSWAMGVAGESPYQPSL